MKRNVMLTVLAAFSRGTGNGRLIGGNMLIAGSGDQWLEGGATMVVGDGHDTVVAEMESRP